MVKTRGSSGKASSTIFEPVKAEIVEHMAASEPPKKRQKRKQADKKEMSLNTETDKAFKPGILPDEASKAKIAKATKKTKKLLQTAHAAENLPTIQHKASKVRQALLLQYNLLCVIMINSLRCR